jgi:hypothetical protein
LVLRKGLAILAKMMRSAVFLATLALLGSACGGSVLDQSKNLFDAGRYADARAKLEKVDTTDYKAFDPHRRATYALYRGLVLGALGDRLVAGPWLAVAKQTEDTHPGTLNRDDAVRLKLAEQQYGPLPRAQEP